MLIENIRYASRVAGDLVIVFEILERANQFIPLGFTIQYVVYPSSIFFLYYLC